MLFYHRPQDLLSLSDALSLLPFRGQLFLDMLVGANAVLLI